MSAAKNERVLGADVVAHTKDRDNERARTQFTISEIKERKQTAAQLLIRSLVQQNVKHIFGIPGGKIMPTFDVLRDEGPQLIVCRHEQNAAFMAAAIGRLTGRPGVCLVTSGPGTGNLVTGVATATTEGDPMVAIGGVVPLADTLKQTHQSMDSVAIMKPVTSTAWRLMLQMPPVKRLRTLSVPQWLPGPVHRLSRFREMCRVPLRKPAYRHYCRSHRWDQPLQI